MEMVRLGKTELMVTKTSFGALPIQRVPMDEAVRLLRKAYDGGINYYDTANAYTDSEEKLGRAFKDVRHHIVISTKSQGTDKKTAMEHIEKSLRMLQTDYIDLFQFHNPAVLPDVNDPDSAFAAALEMKEKGYIRHIGITNHRLNVALEAINTGLYETMQFPFSYLSTEKDLEIVNKCKEKDMGFIAMKGLSGGLLNNSAACYAYMQQFENVVPIWGIQKESELDEWLALSKTDGAMTNELEAVIEKDRQELLGNFCRGCGYCMPCPADIPIYIAARMSFMLQRSPLDRWLNEEWYEKMHRIENCIGCGHCKGKCPYGLDTPELLKEMLKDFDEKYAAYHGKN
ncbi:aldo/keto reductase [Anaerolentibacter hominis]|uniref:aldo/keto reductase n=1 Tax=Anaerolentibacter hominis TaxID=3079009 RepID=UPI0031B800A1